MCVTPDVSNVVLVKIWLLYPSAWWSEHLNCRNCPFFVTEKCWPGLLGNTCMIQLTSSHQQNLYLCLCHIVDQWHFYSIPTTMWNNFTDALDALYSLLELEHGVAYESKLWWLFSSDLDCIFKLAADGTTATSGSHEYEDKCQTHCWRLENILCVASRHGNNNSSGLLCGLHCQTVQLCTTWILKQSVFSSSVSGGRFCTCLYKMNYQNVNACNSFR